MYKTFVTIISNGFESENYQKIKELFYSNGFIVKNELPNTPWNPPREYVDEMGDNLETRVLVFTERKDKNEIILLKSFSENLEAEFSFNGKRKFNINPGFLAEDGMYLLSHKPNQSRGRLPFGPYFTEQQYGRKNNTFTLHPNTFSEYVDRIDEFNKLMDAK